MTVLTIKEVCQQYNISQSELARRFEIPLRTVQHWHSGERKPPEYVLRMISALLTYESRPTKRKIRLIGVDEKAIDYACPACEVVFCRPKSAPLPQYCVVCGQALDWSELKE